MIQTMIIYILVLMSNYSEVEKDYIEFVCKDPQITSITFDINEYEKPEFHKITLHFSTSGHRYEIQPYNMGLNTMELMPFDADNLEITDMELSMDWELDIWYNRPEIVLNIRSISTVFSFVPFLSNKIYE